MMSRAGEVSRLRARFGAGITALALVAILTLCNAAGASPSQQVESATLTTSSDPGAFIGDGGSYSYSTPGSEFQTSISGPGVQNEVDITVRSGSSFWFVDLAAPPGELLAPGTYTGAVRTTSRGPGQPGMDVSANGRGC